MKFKKKLNLLFLIFLKYKCLLNFKIIKKKLLKIFFFEKFKT